MDTLSPNCGKSLSLVEVFTANYCMSMEVLPNAATAIRNKCEGGGGGRMWGVVGEA